MSGAMRLDKLLWYLRLARTRGAAQERIAAGHVRINARRVGRAAQPVAAGDVLTLPLGTGVVVLELLVLPSRRGPASEARACYRTLDAAAAVAIAPAATAEATGNTAP